jgi:hypothetical protein
MSLSSALAELTGLASQKPIANAKVDAKHGATALV